MYLFIMFALFTMSIDQNISNLPDNEIDQDLRNYLLSNLTVSPETKSVKEVPITSFLMVMNQVTQPPISILIRTFYYLPFPYNYTITYHLKEKLKRLYVHISPQ